jgi:hypothetical protein
MEYRKSKSRRGQSNFGYVFLLMFKCVYIIVLLRDVFHIGLVIGPRPAVLDWANTAKTSPIRIFSVLAQFQSVQ